MIFGVYHYYSLLKNLGLNPELKHKIKLDCINYKIKGSLIQIKCSVLMLLKESGIKKSRALCKNTEQRFLCMGNFKNFILTITIKKTEEWRDKFN